MNKRREVRSQDISEPSWLCSPSNGLLAKNDLVSKVELYDIHLYVDCINLRRRQSEHKKASRFLLENEWERIEKDGMTAFKIEQSFNCRQSGLVGEGTRVFFQRQIIDSETENASAKKRRNEEGSFHSVSKQASKQL